ncbi:MAG: PD40 domain-containing protein [Holophagales bacterium]|nr:PD40 domain-containing protein [Holophagales bacterium]
MREMAAAIVSVLATGAGSSASPHPPAPRPRGSDDVGAPRRCRPRSRRRLALAVGACFLAAVAGAAVPLWFGRGGSRGLREGPPLRPVQLTSSAGLDVFPAFSPDGRAPAYASDRSGRFEITAGPCIGKPGDPAHDGRPAEPHPAWSPDGETIAYHVKSVGGRFLVPASVALSRQPDDVRPASLVLARRQALVLEVGVGGRLRRTCSARLPPSSGSPSTVRRQRPDAGVGRPERRARRAAPVARFGEGGSPLATNCTSSGDLDCRRGRQWPAKWS